MSCVGVNIGALTVKVVLLRGGARVGTVVPHLGRPLEVLGEQLVGAELADAEFFGVSGHLGHIPEAAAIQRALREMEEGFDAVASLGGETFLVYLLAGGRIANVLSHNRCAAGSGEFFVQQIGRMGLGLDAAIQRSLAGSVIPLASRCSVHCKSDITHKLNRNEAAPEDILRTLHDSMADKVVALLEKGQGELRRVLLIGGMSGNAALLAALREKLPATRFIVLPESPWFEAWGSALLARDEPIYRSPKLSRPLNLDSLPPLGPYADRVEVIAALPRQAPPDGPIVLGVDAGSTTTKAILLDPSTRRVVAAHYARTRGDPVSAVRECLRALADQVGNIHVGLAGTTGSARELSGAYLGTAHVYNEISAHAAGAAHFDSGVDTIFEIGGQDSKYIHLRNGVPIDYAMNNACSAGTGSFLEESAQGDLGIQVSEIADMALAAPSPAHFKGTCAAFINSDIRAAQQQGHSRDNVVAGLVYAIADNYLNRVKGPRCVGKKIFLQGGVALNRAVGHAFAHSVGRQVVIPPDPELLGALGVGLLALERAGGLLGEGSDLLSLAAPEMKLAGRFTCRACKMDCSIDRFEVAGRRFPFGGRCSLFEGVWKRGARTDAAPDLVEERSRLLFGNSAGGAARSVAGTAAEAATGTAAGAASNTAAGAATNAAAGAKAGTAAGAATNAATGAKAGTAAGAATNAAAGAATGTAAGAASNTAAGATVGTAAGAAPARLRIGIPRALTTHSLFPLYSRFFSALGMDVVLSDVDPRGDLKSNSGFCFPAQIAHGAMLDLARRGVDLVFLPHVVRMPRAGPCRDSYLCPITQAGPYFLAKAFPDLRFLSPLLDFAQGYLTSPALVETGVRDLGARRELAELAWAAAVQAQTKVDRALSDLGRASLEEAVAAGRPAILLAGHSYNAFSPEASQSVGKKLSSMGVTVIPADGLAPVAEGPTAWHFANQIMNAVALARQHPNLFLLCVSNFSCTIDAFTHSMLASELGSKPYLILEIDAHTGDAGVQTRLEAFLDIVRNYRETQAGHVRPFTPCRLASGGRVIRSNGETLPITDPRVKVYFPNFSQYHAEAVGLAARWLGLHPADVIPLDRSQLDRGLQQTSGRECLPLPICVGQLLQVHESRRPGDITGYYMLRGGAPCVADCYLGYFERFIAEQRLEDLFLINPGPEHDYLGLDRTTLARHLSAAIVSADTLVEIEQVLRVVGEPGSVARLRAEWQRLIGASPSLDQFHAELPGFVDWLAGLPRTSDPLASPRVVVTGDFFTRFSPFFMEGVHELYVERGIILKPVDLSDLFFYGAYHGVAGAAQGWGMKPGSLALAKACTRMFQADGKKYLQDWLGYQTARRIEDYYRGIFRESGLLVTGANDISTLFEKASEHVSPEIYGEAIPTVGKGLEAESEGYDGIIVVGPFNCLPYRISEAILRPLSIQRGMPILTFESDGYPAPPSFLRQVDVHIQQVLEHAAKSSEVRRLASGGLAGILRAAFDRLH